MTRTRPGLSRIDRWGVERCRECGSLIGGPLPLTPTQKRVLAYITEYIREHRLSPTLREIAAANGFQPHHAHRHLLRLEAAGWLRRKPRTWRGIIVTADPEA